MIHPTHKSVAQVSNVEFMMEQTFGGAKNHRTVIGPRAWWLIVCPVAAHVFDWIILHGGAIFEFDWNPESISDEGSPQSAKNPFAL
jgi:hypothetical protein